jgi:hypothetical protein
MMKKIQVQYALIAACLSVITISAEQERCSTIKGRVAALIPQAKLFREIYGNAGGVVELEVATPVAEHVELWANIDGFFKRGRSVGLCSPTRIGMTHITFGGKFPYEVNDCITVYAGAGLSLGKIWLRNRSPFCWENISKYSVGGVIKSGVDYFVTERVFVDLFADYLVQPTNFKQRRINTGGLKLGVGVGGTF